MERRNGCPILQLVAIAIDQIDRCPDRWIELCALHLSVLKRTDGFSLEIFVILSYEQTPTSGFNLASPEKPD